MNRLNSVLFALCVVVAVGCTPEALPTAAVETLTRIIVYNDDVVSIYNIGKEQQDVLRDEFDAWRQAGFEGFDESFLRPTPILIVTGTATNGVSYKIDFRPETVLVYESAGELVDGTRYAREVTAADTRFRQFLCTCMATGQLPLLARGRLPNQ